MIKVLQFIDSLKVGGKERQLTELLTFLSKKEDISCELIVMSKDFHYSYINDLDIKIHYLIRKTKKDISIFFKLYKLCKKIHPDIIHSWNSMCSIYAAPIAKILKIKFINGFLRDAPPKFNFRNKEWLRAKLTFPLSDVIVANSLAGLKAYKVPKNKGVCIYNGFNFERVSYLQNKEVIREKFEIKTKFVVGMVASFSYRKDYPTFIYAAQSILSKRNDVTFICIGDGDLLEYCKSLVKPEYKKKIKFLGKQKDVESIINIFDVGVLATNYEVHGEGISNVIMEYMALGKPVVVTDCGGNRELVEDGKMGFIVKPKDPLEMAEKINFLLENRKLAAEFGLRGKERLKKYFNLETMGNNFLKLYKSLCAHKRK